MRKLLFLLVAASCVLSSQALTVRNSSGALSNRVTDYQITDLKITGTMDARDFLFITNNLNELTSLDLGNVTIEAYNKGVALYGTVSNYPANVIPRTAFFGKKLTSVLLPVNLVTIGYAAFAGCDQLQSITLGTNVSTIEDYAFAGSGLTSINLPSTVVNMGKGVFSRCEALQSAVIDAPIVGRYAFLGDISLSNVQLGAHVTAIMDGVFNGCALLKTLNVDPACRISRISDEAFINSGLESIDATAMQLGTIGKWAFAQTHLESLSLPDGMTVLGEGALAHNPLLTSVYFPGIGHNNDGGRGNGMGNVPQGAPQRFHTITRVEDYTFAGDAQLNAGNMLARGVTHLGNYALYDVSAPIDTMRLPASLTYLGDYAMAGMIGMSTLKTDAAEVPALGLEVWAGVDQPSVPLFTPSNESTRLYKAADQWMNFFFQPEEQDYTLGDVNNDGAVNISDVTTLIDYLLGADPTLEINWNAANVNGDEEVNISDVTALIDMLLMGSANNSLQRIRALLNQQCSTTTDALSMQALTMRAGEVRTVEVALNNIEHSYIALQCEVVLPQGVRLIGVEGIDRGSEHSYFSIKHENEQNVYTLMGVSMPNCGYAGNEGNVMRLMLMADETFAATQDTNVTLANVALVTANHAIYLASDAMAMVNNGSGVEDITANKQVAAVRYINVAGQESETPFNGINIVVTTYTDGSVSTVKMMR